MARRQKAAWFNPWVRRRAAGREKGMDNHIWLALCAGGLGGHWQNGGRCVGKRA